jgi:hypothetical protein
MAPVRSLKLLRRSQSMRQVRGSGIGHVVVVMVFLYDVCDSIDDVLSYYLQRSQLLQYNGFGLPFISAISE